MSFEQIVSLLATLVLWLAIYVELLKKAFVVQFLSYEDPLWYALTMRAIILLSSLLIASLTLKILSRLLG